MSTGERPMYHRRITKNLQLVSYDDLTLEKRDGGLPLATLDKNRPMVVLLTWLHAKPRHVKKFLDIYLGKGFDVLTVSMDVWQALWPTIGSHAEVKWWDHSPHIGHFVHHQKEYLEHLDSLLESVGLNDLPRRDAKITA